MIAKQYIQKIVEDKIAGTHLFLVDVAVDIHNAINVFVDSESSVTLENCIELSKYIESNIDREKEDFELVVSSAGLTEPFKCEKQYVKNIGKEVAVITKDGQKHIGKMLSYNGKEMIVACNKKIKLDGHKKKQLVVEQVILPLETVKSTTIYITF